MAVEQLAQANLDRALELQKGRAIAKQEVDADKAELATATANVRSAERPCARPNSIWVTRKYKPPSVVALGDIWWTSETWSTKEQTQLAVIENIDPIYAYFNVSESVLLRFMALVREKKLPDPAVSPPVLSLGLQNEKGFPHQGYLDYTDLGVDPTTGTIRRRAVFPNADRQLVPGLFVRLRTEIGDPDAQIIGRGAGHWQRPAGCFPAGRKRLRVVEYRPVTLGLQADSLRVIEEGIQAGDWIVVNGLQRARPGSKVQAQRAKMSGTVEQAGASSLDREATNRMPTARPDRLQPEAAVPAEATGDSSQAAVAPAATSALSPPRRRPDIQVAQRSIRRQCLHDSSSNARYFANVIAIITMLIGGVALYVLPIEQYPEITPPTIRVTAVYPGANCRRAGQDRRRADRAAGQRRGEHALHEFHVVE